MRDEAVSESTETDGGQRVPPARPRRPYAPPCIESGEAFERAQLASTPCNEGVFDGCPPC